MNDEMSLDEVSVFGGKLSFLIPHDWEEMGTEQDREWVLATTSPTARSRWVHRKLRAHGFIR